MTIFLTVDDFKYGEYKIPQNKNLCNEDLEYYIEKYEIQITQELLGCDMSQDFIDDYNDTAGNMNSTAFQDIFNPLCEDIDSNTYYTNFCYCNNHNHNHNHNHYNCCKNRIIRNNGYLEMLKGFIFFYYMRDFNFERTLTGVTNINNENSNNVRHSEWGLFNFYNKAVKDYRVIQEYIHINKKIYTEYDKFNGIKKNYSNYF